MPEFAVTVYPYNCAFAPYATLGIMELSGRKIEIVNLVSPKGYGLSGRDAGEIDNREPIGLLVGGDLPLALNESNSLLVPEGIYTDRIYQRILEGAKNAAQQGKHVLCAIKLAENDRQLLEMTCAQHGATFLYSAKTARESIQNKVELGRRTRIYRPQASVIFVGELYEDTNGKDVALILSKYFKRKGYQVSTVMDPGVAQLLGMHGTDELFEYMDYPDHLKIDAINEYFAILEEEEHPEVIIVRLPGAMMPFNDVIAGKYGYYAFMLSCALQPDCFICCFPFAPQLDDAAIEKCAGFFNNRFGYSIDCVHLSNVFLDDTKIMETFELENVYLPLNRVDEVVRGGFSRERWFCGNALRKTGRRALCERVEELLGDYGVATAL